MFHLDLWLDFPFPHKTCLLFKKNNYFFFNHYFVTHKSLLLLLPYRTLSSRLGLRTTPSKTSSGLFWIFFTVCTGCRTTSKALILEVSRTNDGFAVWKKRMVSTLSLQIHYKCWLILSKKGYLNLTQIFIYLFIFFLNLWISRRFQNPKHFSILT